MSTFLFHSSALFLGLRRLICSCARGLPGLSSTKLHLQISWHPVTNLVTHFWGVLKASLTQSHDPRRRRARSTNRVNAAHSRATRLSPRQCCHSQDKSPGISTGSKGVMVLGGGEPDALSTGHGPIICGSEISQPDYASQDGQKKKKKKTTGRPLLPPPML